ncbi:transposase [Pseudonocardia sp. Ae168_Ps1]|nr:transposase [Pseudonocardia sp. Ae168_Ps1]
MMVLRWFLDSTRVAQLAADNRIGRSTAYRYLHEGIDVLAATAPGLHGALLAARLAGHTHLGLDGTLIRTDRSKAVGPSTTAEEKPVDLWWSGKHRRHGGNIQVITAPDGWPLWTSPARPGREHDTTCARAHPELLPALDAWTDQQHVTLPDLGYEGETTRLACPITKKPHRPNGDRLNVDQQTVNMLHSAVRATTERGNSLLKTTFKVLRRVSLCPWRIGHITAAALVLLHIEHGRTT